MRQISWRFAVPLTFVAFGVGLPILLGAGCATSVTSPDDDLFAGPPDDAGGAPDTATHHDYDSGHVAPSDGSVTPVIDSAPAIDAAVTIDAAVIDAGVPSAPDAGSVSNDCPASSGKYTIEYLAATALAGEGGAALPSCPCASGMCCYTPPGGLGAPACLAQ